MLILSFRNARSMEFCSHMPISDSINLQLKYQRCTIDCHIQCEIQVIKLDALRGCKPSKQGFWHRIEVGSQRAYVDKTLLVRVRSNISVTRNKVIFHHQTLIRSEVPGVVKRDGSAL